MKHHPPQARTIRRRDLLKDCAAFVGGAAALSEARNSLAEETQSPNLQPPVVDVKGGKLRGFRDGKIFTFLGVPYAAAERFEMPKPVPAWEGVKSAQTWGPVCPIPQASS